MSKIITAPGTITKLKDNIAFVEETDTATHAIAKGQFVVWKGLLHTAKVNISIGDALSSSKLEQVNSGGLNQINEWMTKLGINGVKDTGSLLADSVSESGTCIFRLTGSSYSGGDVPAEGGVAPYSVAISFARGGYRNVILIDESGNAWTNVYAGTTLGWKGWRKIIYRTIGMGSAVDISSYTSTDKYTIPSDGYIRVISGDTVGAYVHAYINEYVRITAKTQIANYREYNSVFVKAGMNVYCTSSNATGNSSYFLPLA